MNKQATDKARTYFIKKGLDYSKVYVGDIFVLTVMLKNEFKKAGKKPIHFSTKRIVKRKNDSIIWCHICTGYFRKQVRINFAPTGSIEFAEQENSDLVLKAFLKWCDYLAEWEEWDVWKGMKEILEKAPT